MGKRLTDVDYQYKRRQRFATGHPGKATHAPWRTPSRAVSPIRFAPDAPPLDWDRTYDQSLIATALATQTELPTVIRNRPVPRSASCHYDGVKELSLTTSPTTFYFY